MGVSLNITTEAWGVDDKSWLKHQFGFDTARSCTLNASLFTADHLLDGIIPSGIVLGRVTASGLYGPYDNAASDGRQVAVGFLLNGARVRRDADETGTITRIAGQFLWQCIVNESKLPNFVAATGKIDGPGKADLIHVRFE
jgi:hypothetical protein